MQTGVSQALGAAALELFRAGDFRGSRSVLEFLGRNGCGNPPLAVLYAMTLSELGEAKRAVEVVRGLQRLARDRDDGDGIRALLESASDWLPGGKLSLERRTDLQQSAMKWLPKLAENGSEP